VSPVRVLLVTDPRYGARRIVEVVRAAAAVPGFAVQLRDHGDSTDDELAPLAAELRAITAAHGALLIVNRRLALARRVAADGFHAPASELAAAAGFPWRSAPAHTDDELVRALGAGATAVLVSPIFETPGKGPPRGVGALRAARHEAPGATLVALGGVDETNAPLCRAAGADAVAVIRALLDAPDPARTAKCLAQASS
jgi:thiamine-phosphate pyrophosphorylase